MTDKKPIEKDIEVEETEEHRVRQVGLTSLNESVVIISNDPLEDLDYMATLAVSLLHELKRNNGKYR